MKRYILAVTGASGMPYALRLARFLKDSPACGVHLIVSDAAARVMALETDTKPGGLAAGADAVHDISDIAAPPSSGSWLHSGMVVCPCSMASLAAIANGLGSNLIHRAADVCLKEGRKLILVPRETPFNQLHMENMLRAARAGATILPACPGFYHRPGSLEDLVDHLVARILDQLDIEHDLSRRWGGI